MSSNQSQNKGRGIRQPNNDNSNNTNPGIKFIPPEGFAMVPQLTYVTTGTNNLPTFTRELIPAAESKYGRLALLLVDEIHYVPPEIETPDEAWNDANDPYQIERKSLVEASLARMKEIRKLKELHIKFSADLWSLISPASRAAVRAYSGNPNVAAAVAATVGQVDYTYATYETTRDPLILWKLIRRTHAGSVTGSALVDAATATRAYNSLKQHRNESTDAFKTRVDDALDRLATAGIELPAEGLQATMYIDALDDHRYSTLRSELMNEKAKGLSTRPATLLAAHSLAMRATYVVTRSQGAADSPLAVFTVQAAAAGKKKRFGRNRGAPSNDTHDGNAPSTGNQRPNRPGQKCALCDAPDHMVLNCPRLQVAKAAVASCMHACC